MLRTFGRNTENAHFGPYSSDRYEYYENHRTAKNIHLTNEMAKSIKFHPTKVHKILDTKHTHTLNLPILEPSMFVVHSPYTYLVLQIQLKGKQKLTKVQCFQRTDTAAGLTISLHYCITNFLVLPVVRFFFAVHQGISFSFRPHPRSV